MKKFSFLLLSFIFAMFASCNTIAEDDGFVKVNLSSGDPVPSLFKFDENGGSIDLTVNSNKDWKVSIGGESWLKAVPTQGGAGETEVQIEISPIDVEDLRLGTVIFQVAGGKSEVEVTIQQMQKGDVDFILFADKDGNPIVDGLAFSSEAASSKCIVNSGRQWKGEIVDGKDWLTISPSEGQSGQTEVQVEVKAQAGQEDRVGLLRLSLVGGKNRTCEVIVTQRGFVPPVPSADLLDVIFSTDGSANDISAAGMSVQHKPGASLSNPFNELYNRTTARFAASTATNITGGYYKIDYADNVDFIDKMKDGHSIEVLFSTNVPLESTNEVKMFSSHQAGGVGMMTKNGYITFLPNTGSTYRFAKSKTIPVPGKYYHAVGVWDKTAGKACIYVDGEKNGETAAPGELTLPAAGSRWFGIGGDANGNAGADASWNGGVVIARIYDKVLSADEVRRLYQEVKVDQSSLILLQDVLYLPECMIESGMKYHIYAKGFETGDIISFDAVSGGRTIEVEGQVNGDEIVVTVPEGFTAGKYQLRLKRGDASCPIGLAEFTVGSVSDPKIKTKVVAHRCYHKNHPQNSLEAFKATGPLGVWGAEIDVHVTTDDKLVVFHDDVIGGKTIENCTYAELPNSNGKPLPLFEDFLMSMNADVTELNMVLEIKQGATTETNNRTVDKCMEMIDLYETQNPGLKDRIVWISFNYEVCKRIVSKWPGTLVMYLGNPPTSPASCFNDGIRGIDYAGGSTSTAWIKEAHSLGMVVNVWTVNDSMEMMKFIGKGVDYITTDNPDVLKTLIEKQFVSR